MKLFSLRNYALTVSEEAYALKPFKILWDRDKNKDKKIAIAELAYIFYMEDFRSDFSDILDDSERSREVIINVGLPKSWKEDVFVEAARCFYKDRVESVISIQYLKDAKHAVGEMSKFFRNIDLSKVNRSGNFVYDISKVKTVLTDSASIIENLNELERIVKRDLQEASNVRGDKPKSPFEDGIQ